MLLFTLVHGDRGEVDEGCVVVLDCLTATGMSGPDLGPLKKLPASPLAVAETPVTPEVGATHVAVCCGRNAGDGRAVVQRELGPVRATPSDEPLSTDRTKGLRCAWTAGSP